MNQRFHLYPYSDQEQRLGLSASLVDIQELEGFTELIEPFAVSLTEVPEDRRITDKWGELSVRPPVPQEKIQEFGGALVRFAESHGLDYHDSVLFIDHTTGATPTEELLKQALARKVGPKREAGQ